nr:MAG TPA: hypothetical protein [Crassvirales sp.]
MIPCAFSQVDVLIQSNLYSSNFSSIGDNLKSYVISCSLLTQLLTHYFLTSWVKG